MSQWWCCYYHLCIRNPRYCTYVCALAVQDLLWLLTMNVYDVFHHFESKLVVGHHICNLCSIQSHSSYYKCHYHRDKNLGPFEDSIQCAVSSIQCLVLSFFIKQHMEDSTYPMRYSSLKNGHQREVINVCLVACTSHGFNSLILNVISPPKTMSQLI